MGSKKSTHPKKKPKPNLKLGRPPTATVPKPRLSSKTTQKTIVTFHTLLKDLEKAKAASDDALVQQIEAEIERRGGIEKYQQASIQGQSVERGGDSSVVLMGWLEGEERGKLLEVGALSTKTACSKAGVFEEIVRIDLNSQAPGILTQDFMVRPLPTSSSDIFDVISLSLVVNFVPSATTRGEMLRRTTTFLRPRGKLFLVLPAPCLLNSRYFNEERLTLLMSTLGYVLLHRKQTTKLVYHLWELRDPPRPQDQSFPKIKLTDHGNMNNFHIILSRPSPLF